MTNLDLEPTPDQPAWFQRVLSHTPMIVVSVVCVAVIVAVWFQLRDNARAQIEQRVDAAGAEFFRALDSELESLEQMLELTRGFYEASERITQDEWAWFVGSTGIRHDANGVLGLGYVELVTPDLEALFLADMRSQVGEFDIRRHPGSTSPYPDPDADRYVIKFHEPAERNRAVWGVDVASLAVNKLVYDQATETNQARLSNFFSLGQSESEHTMGAVMCLPVHFTSVNRREQVRNSAALRGWVSVAIDMDALVNHFWKSEWTNLGLELSSVDTSGQHKVAYSSRFGDAASRPGNILELREKTSDAYGRSLRLSWMPIDGWSTTPNMARANLFLLVSTILGASLVAIVWSLTQTRRRAESLADGMTVSLRESEQMQRELAMQAERANVAKSMFLANMSHEIRTPMTAILGYVDLLNDRSDEISAEDATGAIRRAGNHLLCIINDVLDLSKIEAGHIAIEQERCEIGTLLTEVVRGLEANALGRNLGLTLEVNDNIPPAVLTDPLRVRQILINLIGNAIKFTEEGSVHIRAAFDGDELIVKVRDTGIGIAPDQLERIFSPFEQADNSVRRSHEGTGLGLAISRRLASMMDGAISAESAPGIGSVFTLTIRCQPAPEIEVAEPAGSSEPEVFVGEDRRQRLTGRVLLAEDGQDNQKLITYFLRRVGLEVDVVANGREIIDRINEDPAYDLLITDMQMPVMDGYTATACLREMGHTLPILALTAHAMAGDKERCLEAGCDEYQPKPIDRASLIAAVARMITPTEHPGQRDRAA